MSEPMPLTNQAAPHTAEIPGGTLRQVLATGQPVVVYYDPHTKLRVEGVASLVRHIADSESALPNGEQKQRWRVRFNGESTLVDRWVSTETGRLS